jgi:3,4-dihydroxy 2-butanone 4-phosphate synthase/GTP cyclohydrolase II
MRFSTITELLEDIKAGKMVIVVDDEDRENEGDLVMAAEKVTPEAITFMARHGGGLICVPLTSQRARELGLHLMVQDGQDKYGTAFTVSVDARNGTTTGISAKDRARTIKALIDPKTKPEDLLRPGHVFPLIASEGGVLKRAGHTEAAVDLARLAGLYPAGVICEIIGDDGDMLRGEELFEFAERFGLKIGTIADLIEYRRKREKLVFRVAEADLPTRYGDFRMIVYGTAVDNLNHIALVMGDVDNGEPVMVRVHSECITGEVFGSLRCECGEQLDMAMRMVGKEGRGAIIYLRQEGRGIGLVNKVHAYSLQDKGLDTVEANIRLGFPPDLRDYGIGAQILLDLGIRKLLLLTNNPAKIVAIRGYGLEIVERIPIEVEPNSINRGYLKAKKEKLGHMLSV